MPSSSSAKSGRNILALLIWEPVPDPLPEEESLMDDPSKADVCTSLHLDKDQTKPYFTVQIDGVFLRGGLMKLDQSLHEEMTVPQ